MRTNPLPVAAPIVTLIVVGIALLGFTTPNPFETLWAGVLLLWLLRNFWWRRQPGILLFCLLIPFLEIHTTLLEANQNGLTLNDLFFGTGQVTFWMSSLSLLAVTLGVKACWSIFRSPVHFDFETLRQAASRLHQRRLVLALAGATLLSQAVDLAIPYTSSLRQFETYALGISDALLMVVAIKYMLDRKHRGMVALIFIYLIGVSFYSFFSNWKDPLSILLVAFLVRIEVFNLRQALRLTPILLPIFLLLFVWQSVKGEYRTFLNGGAFSQQIVVSQEDALAKFQELASEAVTSSDLLSDDRINATYRRVGYLEYFSSAVSKVPTEIPHEQGRLLWSNLEFSLLPRFLAPNKGVKDDKAKVEKYTDCSFGSYGGSSFSLGHYCEAYIDWGRTGMLIQLFLFGVLGGGLCLITLRRTLNLNPLLSLGILWVCMKPWGTFQQDMVTMTGQVFWGTICHLFLFIPLYRVANRWIQT